MKLIINKPIVSWKDKYEIYDEKGNNIFYIQGKGIFINEADIYSTNVEYIGKIKQKSSSFFSIKYLFYNKENLIGTIIKKKSILNPKYLLQINDYTIEGDFTSLNYSIKKNDVIQANIHRKIVNMKDMYSMDILNEENINDILILAIGINLIICAYTSSPY